jgi:Transposase, Mutator family
MQLQEYLRAVGACHDHSIWFCGAGKLDHGVYDPFVWSNGAGPRHVLLPNGNDCWIAENDRGLPVDPSLAWSNGGGCRLQDWQPTQQRKRLPSFEDLDLCWEDRAGDRPIPTCDGNFCKIESASASKTPLRTREEIETRRKAFIRKWRLKHRAVADSSAESGDRLFTFTRLPPPQWRSVRTTNAIERLHEEFKRRIKTQIVLRSADTAAMLFWALLASGQINMRKVDGWQTLATKPIDQPIDLAAWSTTINLPKAWFLLFRPPLMTAYRLRFRRVPNPDVTVGLRKALWLIRIDASHHFDANQ